MKKLLAILMCASLVFCASCGKKDAEVKNDEKKAEVKQENPVEKAVKDIDKAIAESVESVDTGSIAEAKKEADVLAEELQDKVGNVPEEEIEEFQVQQVAVAILQQGLEALEKAQESGDEAAIEEAKQMIEMAKGMWDYQPEE